jgi:hypothetical protein
MPRTLPLLAAIAVVISSGAYQGVWSHRWTASREIAAAVALLDHIPREFGDWVSVDAKLDERQLEPAAIAGYVSRRYERGDGAAASILLVCGRTGPISVHAPDICYAGAGFEIERAPARYVVETGTPPQPAQFWVGDFIKRESVIPQRIRIYWSWNATGSWAAPENPRPFFAGSQALYKMYVISELTGPASAAGGDPAAALIRDLLPVLQRALAPGGQTPPSGHS